MYTAAADIVFRAQTVWPLESVPYSQGKAADCSAFVSAVLGIPRKSTVTLVTENYIRPLAGGEHLEAGDFIGICGPGTEGDDGHIAVVEAVFLSGVFGTIEQVGPTGHLGPVRRQYSEIPVGFLPYRVIGREDEAMTLEIPRDRDGVMWISRDRVDRRPLYNDEDVRYFLDRGAGVPDQPETAVNGAPCVANIELFGANLHVGPGAPAVLDLAALREAIGDELAERLRA